MIRHKDIVSWGRMAFTPAQFCRLPMLIFAAMLFVAGTAKCAHSMFLSDYTIWDSGNILSTLGGVSEIGVGVWILQAQRCSMARLISCCILAGFVGSNLSAVILSRADCGCFGSFRVSPLSLLALDGVFLAAILMHDLLVTRRVISQNHEQMLSVRPRVCLLVFLIAGASLLGAFYQFQHVRGQSHDRWANVLSSNSIFLYGRHSEQQVSLGRWVILAYRDGCGDCEAALREFLRHAEKQSGCFPRTTFLIVDVGGGKQLRAPSKDQGVAMGRVDAINFATPALLVVQDGRVVKQSGPDEVLRILLDAYCL